MTVIAIPEGLEEDLAEMRRCTERVKKLQADAAKKLAGRMPEIVARTCERNCQVLVPQFMI
jgi:hypothetical protein